MKRRKLTMLLCILSVFAVASVGFAAWLITSAASEDATGTITAAPAEDNIVSMTLTQVASRTSDAAPDADKTNVVFGPSATGGTNDWLVADEIAPESLEFWFKVVINPSKVSDSYGYYQFSALSLLVGSGSDWAAAPASASGNYYFGTVELLDSTGAAVDTSVKIAKGAASHVYHLHVVFNWGDKFAATSGATGSNPYQFFNNFAYDAKPAAADYHLGNGSTQITELAKTQLNGLNSAVAGKNYKVTVTVTPVK